jgi:hypothetical protein
MNQPGKSVPQSKAGHRKASLNGADASLKTILRDFSHAHGAGDSISSDRSGNQIGGHRLLSVSALNEWGSYSDGSSFGLSVRGTSDFDFNMKLTHARIATYECF